MFRTFNLKTNNKNKDRLVLYKNSREEYCEIPVDFIDEVNEEFMESSTLNLTIPNKTTNNGATVDNHVFDKILGKRQQMRFNDDRYVITECDRDDTKDKKVKNIVAKSYDITLEDSYLYAPMGGYMRHLIKREGEYETADGYLDLFVKENPIWSIGHVDDSCRTELNKVSVEQEISVNNISIDKVDYDTVLFEQEFNNIQPNDDNSTVGIRLSFREMENYDSVTNNLLNTQTKVCDLGLFHIGVKKVKATFIRTDNYRYAAEFLVTLVDNSTVTRECEFVDIKGYNVRCSKGVLLFTDGRTETVSMLKYRNLEENTYTWRNVLTEYITESFDCFVVFDNKDLKINVYDKKTFGENKGLYFSYDNFVKGINKKYQYENIISKLVVESEQDGLSITDENPLGTDYILNYDYFINNGIMSGECANAWKLYEARIDGVQEELYNLRVELNTKNSLKIKLETETYTLEEQIKGLEAIRVGYVKENDTDNVNRLTKEINEKYDRVKEIIQQLSILGDEITTYKNKVQEIIDSIDMNNATDSNGNKIFTVEDLLEIQSLTIEETYTDKYYLTNYGLYNNSKAILEERNKLQIDFSIDSKGLLQNIVIPNGMSWDYYIKIGDKVNLDSDDILGDIRIVKITYSPKDYNITDITFTNKDKEIDDLKSIGNIGRTVSKLETNNNMYKPEWKKGMDANKYVSDMLNYGLNLKATGIRSRSYSCKTDFSESGLFVIDGYDENRQIFLAGGIMAITDDRFETLKVCIDTDGVVAETIVGKLIVGHNLIIANENNSMIIDKDGITIEANKLTIKGIEGDDYSFTSYFEMVNNEIKLGVKNSKDYTDTQIKMVDGKIELKIDTEDAKSLISQSANDVTFKFSNSGGMNLVKDGQFKSLDWNNGKWWWYDGNLRIYGKNELGIGFYAEDSNLTRLYSNYLNFKPNTTYTIRADVTKESNVKWFAWFVEFKDASGNIIGSFDAGQLGLTFTTPSNCTHGYLIATHGGRTNTNESYVVWLNNVAIFEGTVELPYAPHPDEIYEGSTRIDGDGVSIYNGGLVLENILGQLVMSCDKNGWLKAGNLFITGAESPSNLEIGGSNDNKGVGIRSQGTTYIDFAMLPKEASFGEQVDTGGLHRIICENGTKHILKIIGDTTEFRNFYGATKLVVQGSLTSSQDIISDNGNVKGVGIIGTNLSISGSKNCNQRTENYGNRLINAYETAESYFGDLGEGVINSGGECLVYIDDIFGECINTDMNYHVFTQVYEGSINGIDRKRNYFIVKGTPGTVFSWEFKAKRYGFEYDRLEFGEEIKDYNVSDDLFHADNLVYINDDFYIEDDKELENILLNEEE